MDSTLTHEHSFTMSTATQSNTSERWQSLADQLQSSTRILFQDSNPDLFEKLNTIILTLRHDCEKIQSAQTSNFLTVALYGTIKSFNLEVLSALLPDGKSATDFISGSDEVTWLGPDRPPAGAGSSYVATSLNLSVQKKPFALAYSCTQECPEIIRSASVKILTVRTESLRDGEISRLLARIDGSLILPVIRFNPKEENDQDKRIYEYKRYSEKWEGFAPETNILAPIFLPDLNISGDKAEFDKILQTQLEEKLTPVISDTPTLVGHREKQLQACESRAKKEITTCLKEFRQRLGSSIDDLNSFDQSLVEILTDEFIGNEQQLHLGLRSRFRADTLERTNPLFFPFRSLLGILGLTQGAWDRLIFTSLGSIPSLVMGAIHSLISARKSHDFNESFKEQAVSRIHSRITDNCVDGVRNFYTALHSANQESSEHTDTINYEHLIRIQGISGLQITGEKHLSKTVGEERIKTGWLRAFGGLATVIFWVMLSGPLISLYIQYVQTLSSTYLTSEWQQYPTPPVSLWISSILLSVFPAFIIGMITMQLACGRSRVDRSCAALEEAIQTEIETRILNKQLKITLNDSKLDAAQFLLKL